MTLSLGYHKGNKTMNKFTFTFAASIMGILLLAACGAKVDPTPAAPAAPVVSNEVQPLNNPGLLELPTADGRTPCGVFDLITPGTTTGWGPKTADLTQWPACTGSIPPFEILCLDGNAQWVTPALTDLALDPTGSQVSWTSEQEGTCGFFAK